MGVGGGAQRQRPPAGVITLILSLSGVVASLNQTLVIPLIAVMPAALDCTAEQASWLVTITLVVGAVSIPAVSRLADMWGRRLMLAVCLVVMTAGALVSGFGSEYVVVLVGRALAGFGVPLVPLGISVLRESLPLDHIGTAVALMSATLGVGTALGLPLSGVIFDAFGWRWAFWLIAIVGFALALAVILVVTIRVRASGERFDLPGAFLLAVATASGVLVISQGAVWGWTDELTLVLIVVAAASLTGWLVVELRVREPLVDLRVSARRPVLLTNVTAVLVGFALFINLLVAMQQLQAPVETGYGFGLPVLDASIYMIPNGLMMLVLSPLNGRMLDRWGGRQVLAVGLVVMCLGYVARVLLSAGPVQIAAGATIVSVGTAFVYAAMPTIIMNAVPEELTAAANGLNALLRQVGLSLSSASVAAAIGTGTIVVGGIAFADWDSLVLLNVLAGAACICGMILTLLIPRGHHQASEAS